MKRLGLVFLCAALGCGRSGEAPGASASASTAAPSPAPPPRLGMILSAERSRDSSQVSSADLSNRNVGVRRAAARALARIADRRSAELLRQAISDEDLDVVAWAAYGLGFACPVEDQANVRALTVRAAAWTWSETQTPSRFDVSLAFAQALARCGTRDAETTLRAWLSAPAPLGEAAAMGLASLASRRNRLDDASIVALLDAADRADGPLHHALLAFGHLDNPSDSVRRRLVAVAQKAMERPPPHREFAIRALGLGGDEAVPLLAPVLLDPQRPVAERAEAARQLVRAGEAGQTPLATALAAIAPQAATEEALVTENFAPFAATLDGLEGAPREAREVLAQLAEMAIPENSSPAVQRRAIWIRCRAAALLAGSATLSGRLVACDPTGGREGALAIVEVLDRGRIEKARYRRWQALAQSEDPIVREAALRLVVTHPEIERPHEILVAALGTEHQGVVATAANILASFPDRASDREVEDRAVQGGPLGEGEATAPRAEVVDALTQAMTKATGPEAVGLQAALIDAVGALQLLSFKPQLTEACASEQVVLRQRAQRALRLLGERRRECAPPTKKSRAPAPTLLDPQRLELKTDVGNLVIRLDAPWTPLARTRIVELARSGFYDNTIVHRAIPGFVVQFGDPDGDGFGGPPRPPLPCETSPVAFTPHSVGIAISGRDTGSSQLFVTLGRYPHLDGQFTRVGTAEGEWESLVVGDVIHRVTVKAH